MVHDVSREMGIEVEIADTTQDAWQWRNVKRKTDEDAVPAAGRTP